MPTLGFLFELRCVHKSEGVCFRRKLIDVVADSGKLTHNIVKSFIGLFSRLVSSEKQTDKSAFGKTRPLCFFLQILSFCLVHQNDYYKYSGVADGEYHWLGTDYLGRDLLTRLFRGARISLIIAAVSVAVNLVIGVVYGAISGYCGGKIDIFLTHLAEVLDGMPYVVVTILFMLVFGAGMFSIILAMTVTGWIGTSRLIRAQFYRFKGREYVLAARTMGVPDKTLIFRHILPNCVGPLIIRAMIAVPGAIFSEAFLAYIGLGIAPPEPSIGILLSNGQSVLLQYPYQVIFPAVLISLLMVAFNLFANGLRDALDPTKRGEE